MPEAQAEILVEHYVRMARLLDGEIEIREPKGDQRSEVTPSHVSPSIATSQPMKTPPFDTHRCFKRLTKVGIPEAQAEVLVEHYALMARILSGESEIKKPESEIKEPESEIKEPEGEIKEPEGDQRP